MVSFSKVRFSPIVCESMYFSLYVLYLLDFIYLRRKSRDRSVDNVQKNFTYKLVRYINLEVIWNSIGVLYKTVVVN